MTIRGWHVVWRGWRKARLARGQFSGGIAQDYDLWIIIGPVELRRWYESTRDKST